jgi:hypothetical protein
LSIPQDTIVAADIADNSVDIARLNVTDGTAGQFLKTDGNNVLGFASVVHPYGSWGIINTTPTNLLAQGQYIFTNAGNSTHNLPSGSAGDTVVMHNAGTGTVTVGRNSQNINSTADDGELLANATTQLVYVSTAIGWKEI